MDKRCPHCGASLREDASFCPHCAKSVNLRQMQKPPVARRRHIVRAVLGLLAAAALALGLWLHFRPRVYDGLGEVLYTDRDGTWQVCIAWADTPFTGSADRYTNGQTNYDYRYPSLLYINDAARKTHAGEEFLQKVDRVTAEFVQPDEALHISCTVPKPRPDYVPDANSVTFVDFNISAAGEYTAELVITVHLKNGDRIRVHQNQHFSCVNVYDYTPEDAPMETLEELQALVDELGRTLEPDAVVNLHLPPVTYEGELVLSYRDFNLCGSSEDEERTTFTGTIWMEIPTGRNICTFEHINFTGGGSGVGVSAAGCIHLIDCAVTGWEIGVLVSEANAWGWAADCRFEDNGVGFLVNSSRKDGNNISNIHYSGNTFANNGAGVVFQRTDTDLTLSFEGCRFTGNGIDIDNRCNQPLDLSEAVFE